MSQKNFKHGRSYRDSPASIRHKNTAIHNINKKDHEEIKNNLQII